MIAFDSRVVNWSRSCFARNSLAVMLVKCDSTLYLITQGLEKFESREE